MERDVPYVAYEALLMLVACVPRLFLGFSLLLLLSSYCHAATELLITIPVEIEGQCYCCAFLNAVESTLALRQSAEHFCTNYGKTQEFDSCSTPSLIVTPDICVDRLERAFLQRLRINEEALLLPILLNGNSYYFYARSMRALDAAAASFCAFHDLGAAGCVAKLRTAVHRRAMDHMLAHARSLHATASKDEDASRVYVWPVGHADTFVREQLTVQEGLWESRRVTQVGSVGEADYVLHLWTAPLPLSRPFNGSISRPLNGSTAGQSTCATEDANKEEGRSPLGNVPASKLVCLDFSDSSELAAGLSREHCRVIFKRSFVAKHDGRLLSRPYPLPTHPSTVGLFSPLPDAPSEANEDDDAIVYPLSYAALGAYFGLMQTEYGYRDVSIACTLRPHGARTRVLQWVTEAVEAWGLEDAFVGQITDTSRHTVDKAYQQLLGRTRIVVTAHPTGWDGDMRLWEALSSGALVFSDPLLTPLPLHRGLRDREHLVIYDNGDRASLLSVLEYYLAHPQEAADIARHGREFVKSFHRAGSRMDYIDAVVRARADRGEEAGEGRGAGGAGPGKDKDSAYAITAGEDTIIAEEMEIALT